MNIKDWTTKIATNVIHVDRLAGALESVALAITTRAASWIATIPTVILTSRSTQQIFGLTPTQALISSIALEIVGQAVVNTWMKARDWNTTRRANDPPANEAIGLLMSVIYFATDFILIGVLIVPQALVSPVYWAAILFPLAQVVSTVMTAERAAQFRRETTTEMIAQDRAQQRAQRRAQQHAQQLPNTAHQTAQHDAQRAVLDAINRTRQERKTQLLDSLLDAYLCNPDLGITDAARALGVHRNTVYNYLDELEAAGRLKRNGNGVEVLG